MTKLRRGLIKAGHIARLGPMTVQTPTPFHKPSPIPEKIAFDRQELGVILGLYGRMVSAGEWRDYGMSFLKDVAIFSIFRRAAEHPIYRLEKRPQLRGKQGMYSGSDLLLLGSRCWPKVLPGH